MGKYSYKMKHQGLKGQFRREINSFPSIFSVIGSVLSIFLGKIEELNPSERDIKVPIPVLTSQFTNTFHFLDWEKGKNIKITKFMIYEQLKRKKDYKNKIFKTPNALLIIY